MKTFRWNGGLVAMALIVALCGVGVAHADSAQTRAGGPPGHPPEPPAEAYEACVDKAEGDAVTLTAPDGRTMEATCQYHKGQEKLAARPARGPHERPNERPNQ